MEQQSCKIHVDVLAEFSSEESLLPRQIYWKDGRKFIIDRVLKCVRATNTKAGGVGLRYTVMICGQEKFLYYEENYKWFVEGKTN